jgi:hypothetical protein
LQTIFSAEATDFGAVTQSLEEEVSDLLDYIARELAQEYMDLLGSKQVDK